MKVIYLHNHSYPDYIGGAELTDLYWIKKERELGMNVLEKTPGTGFSGGDFCIIGNFGKFEKAYLKRVCQTPYIYIVHHIPEPENFINFYQKACCIVFMAPSHFELYQKKIKNQNIVISPPYIDSTVFRDYKKPRIPNSYLYVGAIREHKGIRKILLHAKKNLQNNYHFYGPTKEKEVYLIQEINNLKNCKYHGIINNNEVAKIMNQYETFIEALDHKINKFQSFERTIAEALLCGMKLHVNKKDFGLFSWNWDFGNRNAVAEQIEEHYDKFWAKILGKVYTTFPTPATKNT